MDETYLGDGLYVSFDGWQYQLRAPREEATIAFISMRTCCARGAGLGRFSAARG
jgi:hypothetical protein